MTPEILPPSAHEETEDNNSPVTRRTFLQQCTAAFSAASLPKVLKGTEEAEEKEKLKKRWETRKPPFNAPPGYEVLNPDVVFNKDNSATLHNRGLLLSKQELPKGGTVKFTWTWTGGDIGEYQDHLSVVLRTNGTQRGKWPCEIETGIVVAFNPTGDFIYVSQYDKEKPLPPNKIGRKDGVKIEKDKQYDVAVTDNGDSISVKFGDTSFTTKKTEDTFLPVETGHWNAAIYNREPVGGPITKANVKEFAKISVIDDLELIQDHK